METRRTANWLTWLAGFIACICTWPALADSPLQPYRAIYSLEIKGSDVARSTHHLVQARDHLHFSQDTELSGFLAFFRDDTLHEETDISTDGRNWRLKHYQLSQTGDSKRRDMHFDIDWQQQDDAPVANIKGTYIGENFDASTSGEIWDPLSVLLALQRDQLNDKTDFQYQVVSKGQIRLYDFKRTLSDSIEVDEETHDCVLFTRESGRRETRIWLSRDAGLAPVRIEQHKDGELDSRMDLISLTR